MIANDFILYNSEIFSDKIYQGHAEIFSNGEWRIYALVNHLYHLKVTLVRFAKWIF